MINVILNNETLMISHSSHTQEKKNGKSTQLSILNIILEAEIDGWMSLWMEDKHWEEGTEAVLIS